MGGNGQSWTVGLWTVYLGNEFRRNPVVRLDTWHELWNTSCVGGNGPPQRKGPEMVTETETTEGVAPVIAALQGAYGDLAAHVKAATGVAMPPATIIVKRDSRAWGHITVRPAWQADREELDTDYGYGHVAVTMGLGMRTVTDYSHEIMVSGENLARGAVDVFGTLAHEAAHAFNIAANIHDVDSNGRHNKKFKDTAERLFGLEISEYAPNHWAGWTKTEVPLSCRKTWKATIARIDDAIKVHAGEHKTTGGGWSGGFTVGPVPTGGRNKNGIKATCGCGSIIRTSQKALDKGITCGECEQMFVGEGR